MSTVGAPGFDIGWAAEDPTIGHPPASVTIDHAVEKLRAFLAKD
jgi:hypothetical protein